MTAVPFINMFCLDRNFETVTLDATGSHSRDVVRVVGDEYWLGCGTGTTLTSPDAIILKLAIPLILAVQ